MAVFSFHGDFKQNWYPLEFRPFSWKVVVSDLRTSASQVRMLYYLDGEWYLDGTKSRGYGAPHLWYKKKTFTYLAPLGSFKRLGILPYIALYPDLCVIPFQPKVEELFLARASQQQISRLVLQPADSAGFSVPRYYSYPCSTHPY